jgi:hypothetical protein
MAGVGPAPKDPSRRARRNKDVVQLRVVEVQPAGRPDLPEFDVELKRDGESVMVPFQWPAATRDWWEMLDLHPLKNEFTELDWSFLMDTARFHAAFWHGNLEAGKEVRLREAKYGFTPEDRARLRIQFAQAMSAEAETVRKVDQVQSARDRMKGITRRDSA